METEISELHLLDFPDEILIKILSFIPNLELFWSAGMSCRKLFGLSCERLDNTIELREKLNKSDAKADIGAELLQHYRLDQIFRTNVILNCVSHIIIPSYSHNCFGKSISNIFNKINVSCKSR